jgi:Tfp pilus assembly protein PilE
MNRKRSAREDGVTLIDLVIVITIIGILLAIMLTSYVGYRAKANSAVARANVQVIAPSIEAYYVDKATYVGMTLPGLKDAYDQSIVSSVYTLNDLTETSYCASSTVGGQSWKKGGPGTVVARGACS